MKIISHEANTDLLGTFSGDVERTKSVLETAVTKAKLGLQETGLRLGLASEGTIGPDPVLHFLTSDIELMVLVDLEHGIEIVETFRSFDINAAIAEVEPDQNLDSFLTGMDFPNHSLIVTPRSGPRDLAIKGLVTKKSLSEAILKCASESKDGFAIIQPDFRAHHSPSRQKNIASVANLLVERIASQCPNCKLPGWGRTDALRGLNCSDCGALTPNVIRQHIFGCVSCEYQELGPVLATAADPGQCDICNP